VQRPKDSRQDSAENKRDLLEPELVLNKERFGVQFAKVRHQLVVERFEVARKSWALCLRLGWNDLLISRRRPPQRWQSFKQSHEILLLLDEHTAQLDFQGRSGIVDMKQRNEARASDLVYVFGARSAMLLPQLLSIFAVSQIHRMNIPVRKLDEIRKLIATAQSDEPLLRWPRRLMADRRSRTISPFLLRTMTDETAAKQQAVCLFGGFSSTRSRHRPNLH
jgi:hypothetical protein